MKIIAVYDSIGPDGTTKNKILVWPDSVMIKSRKPLFLPDDGEYYLHRGLCARIDAVGKSIKSKFAQRYYKEVAPMVYVLPASVSDLLVQKKDPNACDIVADYSLICGDFINAEEADCREAIDHVIPTASERNTLKTGDIVATIDLEREPAKSDTTIKISLAGKTLLENKIK